MQDSLVNQVIGPLHDGPRVWRAPAARVDRHVLKAVVESSRLVDIRYFSGEDADTCDLGVVGNTDAARGILPGSDLARTPRAMRIVGKLWRWQGFVIIEVVGVVGGLGKKN